MAGQVPQSAPPGFASSFGDVMGNQAKNRADILGAELESNSANLGHILSNITKIAEVGGGALTPDRLLAAYAGSKGDIIDDQYSQGADARRAAQELANIASTNRRGTGGGGKGGSTGGNPGNWLVRNKLTGETTWFDPADKDAQVLNDLTSGNHPSLDVLRYGTLDGVPENLPTLPSNDPYDGYNIRTNNGVEEVFDPEDNTWKPTGR